MKFDLGAGSGWNFVVVFLGQEMNIVFLRKESYTLGVLVVKGTGVARPAICSAK